MRIVYVKSEGGDREVFAGRVALEERTTTKQLEMSDVTVAVLEGFLSLFFNGISRKV